MMKYFFLLLFILEQSAIATVFITDTHKKIDNFTIQYYHDKSGLQSINDIQNKNFSKLLSNQLSLGFTKGNNWFKFEIKNQSDLRQFILYTTESFFYHVNLYEFKNKKWIEHKNGLSIKMEEKEIQNKYPTFLIAIKKDELKTIYIQTSTLFPHFVEFQIYPNQELLIKYESLNDKKYMFYLGGLFIIIVFNLFLFLTLKDIIYAYYVGYTYFYLQFVFVLTGYPLDMGLENWYYEFHTAAPLVIAFLLLFTNEILNIKTYSIFLSKILYLITAIEAVIFLLVLWDIKSWYVLVLPMATLAFNVLLYTSVYAWIKGIKDAKIYLIALTIYLTAMVLFTAMANGWIENTDINRYSFLYASFFEIIFFALMLANRFNKTNKEKIITLENLRLKDKQLQAKSRMAQMGEMIGMIAHQWRQPLGAINSAIFSVQTKLLSNRYNLEDAVQREEFMKFLKAKHSNVNEYVQFLSTTIDDFRNFFKKDKEKEYLNITDHINRALKIVKIPLENKGINIVTQFDTNKKIYLYQNEMMQVILNILKNSEDNFDESNNSNKTIVITTKDEKDKFIITIYDNGGGIKEDIIDNIFDPYFSTKNEKNGTGLGLYISKIIVEKHNNGIIKVNNIDEGVFFTMEFIKSSI